MLVLTVAPYWQVPASRDRARVWVYSVALEGVAESGAGAGGVTLVAGNEVAGACEEPAGVAAGAGGNAAAPAEDARSSPSRCFGVTRASMPFL